MARAKISQMEARRLKQRVAELERIMSAQRRVWARDYPGVHISSITIDATTAARLETARRLSHFVVATPDTGDSCRLYLYAVKP